MTSPLPFRWYPVSGTASPRWEDVFFVDPELGWAVDGSRIYRTRDGGGCWQEQFSIASLPGGGSTRFRSICFANALRGWAGALGTGSNRLFSTADGGQTWRGVDNLPPEAPPRGICGLWAVDDWVVYGAGTNEPTSRTGVIKSVDGGCTWTGWDLSAQASNLIDIYFRTPDEGWVVGGLESSTPSPVCEDNPGEYQALVPVVLHTRDGGRNWTNRVRGLRFPTRGEWGWKIQFLDDRVGFVSLESFCDAAILRTKDGGRRWRRLPVQGNANIQGVGFLDEKKGWVGGWGPGLQGTSSVTVDGGKTWQVDEEVGAYINRFRFLGHPVEVGYSVGERIYKYSDRPTGTHRGLRFLSPRIPPSFSESVRLAYELPYSAERVTLTIFNQFGVLVRRLIDEANAPSGPQEPIWDGTNDAGERVWPEYYVYRLIVDRYAESGTIRLEPPEAPRV